MNFWRLAILGLQGLVLLKIMIREIIFDELCHVINFFRE